MKKIIAFVLVSLLTVSAILTFAACNPKSNGNQSDFTVPEEGYDGQPVTIKLYSSMGQAYASILEDCLEEFNEMYPNITIEHNRIGDYDSVYDQIYTEVSSGTSPDIAFCYGDHVAQYNRAKVVVKLDSLINSQVEVTDALGNTSILGLTQEEQDDFIDIYWEEGKSFGDGYMYMLPLAKSTELMYVNETFLKSKGISVPDHWFATDGKEGLESSDTTSMEYVLAAIKEQDPKCIPLGYDAADNWLITLFEQFETGYTSVTGENYLFNNEENYELVKTLRRWYQNGWFTTKSLLGGNTYTSTYFTSLSSEEGKKSYISIGSSAGAAHQLPSKVGNSYPFEVGVYQIPQKEADSNNAKVISQGPSICLFKSSNPQKVVASWLLLKFLVTNKDFQARYSMEAGYLPVIESVMELDYYEDFFDNADYGDNIAAMAAKMCLEAQDTFFVSPAFGGSATARQQMTLLFNQSMVVKGSTDEEITSGIKAAFEKALQNCKS